MEPVPNHYSNTMIRLPDLAVTGDVLTGLTFDNCQLVGPAIIVALGGTQVVKSGFDGPGFDAIAWPFDDDRQVLIGTIGLMDCRIYNCRFTRIGIAVPRSDLDSVRRGLGG